VACGCVWLIYSLGTNLADDHDWVGVVPAILVGVLITIAVYGVRRHRERRRSTRQRDT
jgi:membrane protein DedA with SNARE-associated domain